MFCPHGSGGLGAISGTSQNYPDGSCRTLNMPILIIWGLAYAVKNRKGGLLSSFYRDQGILLQRPGTTSREEISQPFLNPYLFCKVSCRPGVFLRNQNPYTKRKIYASRVI